MNPDHKTSFLKIVGLSKQQTVLQNAVYKHQLKYDINLDANFTISVGYILLISFLWSFSSHEN